MLPPRCNRHLLGLGQHVKKSLTEEGIIGYQFGTVGVSDGISMGTAGMSYSLQSRDLIADAVETAAGGHWLDLRGFEIVYHAIDFLSNKIRAWL